MISYDTIYFAGYAKLPIGIPSNSIYSYLSINLIINIRTGIIEEAESTLMSKLAQKMVRQYLTGKHILDDYEAIVEEIAIRHQGVVQKALIMAFRDINKKYQAFCQKYDLPGGIVEA